MDFYLFNVEHGQSAAARLPNGRWCLFDAGSSARFSPTRFIQNQERQAVALAACLGLRNVSRPPVSPFSFAATTAVAEPPFRYLKTTVSHLHHDHLSDWEAMMGASPEFLRTVDFDRDYLLDVAASSGNGSFDSVVEFCRSFNGGFDPATSVPNYGGAIITELSLPVAVARQLGSTANARVNNASVVTRINCNGNSILLCGDMETTGWDFVLNPVHRFEAWRALVSNVDILVAPHHGHSSAYSTLLMSLARPAVVLVSVRTNDDSVDSRYSSDAVRGLILNGETYKRITTRDSGTIKVNLGTPKTLFGKGLQTWSFEY